MKNLAPYVWLSVIFFAMVCFIHPTDDFPLNDDWSYARVVQIWLQSGKVEFGAWPAMTLIAHAFWGKLFCSVFGFSHVVLRCSTLVLALCSGWIMYFLAFKITAQRKAAFVTALLLVANPIFFWLSNTFMTDLPFLFSILLCILFSERFIETKNLLWLLALVCASIYSLLIRQFALVLPLALLVLGGVSLLKRDYKFALLSVAPFVVCFLVFQWFSEWHKLHSPETRSFVSSALLSKVNLATLWQQSCERLSELCFALGLFLLPFWMVIFLRIRDKIDIKTMLWMIIPASILFFCISRSQFNFPLGNILTNWGTGPDTLFDTMVLHINLYHVYSQSSANLIEFLSRLGLVLLVLNVSYFIVSVIQKRIVIGKFKLFLILVFTCYFLFMSISESYFDRYLIVLVAIASLFIGSWPAGKRAAQIVIASYITLTAFFSLMGVHDYFEWNRARYQLAERTLSKGVDPESFNGGFEYMANRYYHYEFWWAVWNDDKKKYYLTFGDMPGYQKENFLTYQRYLPYEMDTIFVVKRMEVDSAKVN